MFAIRVCFVGDDVHPPWNHASSVLVKRLIECTSSRAECFLATVSSSRKPDPSLTALKTVATAKPGNVRSLVAMRLSIAARETSPDIIHLVGTNALVFSPFSKLLRTKARIIRHIFTSYDRNDLAARPIRWFTNTLFIDSYAFTTPRIGQWAEERHRMNKRFLVRPPINCDLYRPLPDCRRDSAQNGPENIVLYMGPLWSSRFPAERVLKGLKLLLGKGLDPHLLVLTSATRTSVKESDELLALGRSLGLEDRLAVHRVDLSEEERVVSYNEADVVIFPYLGPLPEKLADPPFGLLEAMACGRMVLATNVLSISEVVDDGKTGFVAGEPTPEEIGRTLYRALTSNDRKRIERNARDRILTDFSYPRICDDLMSAYRSLIE